MSFSDLNVLSKGTIAREYLFGVPAVCKLVEIVWEENLWPFIDNSEIVQVELMEGYWYELKGRQHNTDV